MKLKVHTLDRSQSIEKEKKRARRAARKARKAAEVAAAEVAAAEAAAAEAAAAEAAAAKTAAAGAATAKDAALENKNADERNVDDETTDEELTGDESDQEKDMGTRADPSPSWASLVLAGEEEIPEVRDEFDKKCWLSKKERELPFEKEAAAIAAEAMDTRE